MAMFGDSYRDFIGNVEAIAHAAMTRKRYPATAQPLLEHLLRNLVMDLRRHAAVLAIEAAANQLPAGIQDYLLQELQFFNSLYSPTRVSGTPQELEDASTCKESLEDILGDGLPGWLKHALKILDQILKLVR